MNPYPLASLNHFTCPCAILRPLSSGVFSPCVLPPSWRGYLPELAGKPALLSKKKRRGDAGPRGVCLGLFTRSDSVCSKKPTQELHVAADQVNPFSTARVTGREPFLLPSHPGMATEKRPAVPPATTMWISSGDGNLEISASGAGGSLENRRLVLSPWSSSGSSER